jgi:hypothetical protein
MGTDRLTPTRLNEESILHSCFLSRHLEHGAGYVSLMSHRSYSTSATSRKASKTITHARGSLLTLTCRHDVQLLALDFFAVEVEVSIFGAFAIQFSESIKQKMEQRI